MSTDVRWSQPVETLLDCAAKPLTCDVLIIGSGYGGSFAAAELAQPGRTVWVMERGNEYALGEFPEDIGQLPGHVRYQPEGDADHIGKTEALLDLRLFKQVGVLVANGVGGGSLINAGVALQPDPELFDRGAWPRALRTDGPERKELFLAMCKVERTLEAQPFPGAPGLSKFAALGRLGDSIGAPVVPVPLTIAGVDRVNAQGLQQKACIRCGNCFTGCNPGAKNTLLTNVIPAAARAGACFYSGATAVEIEPLTGGGGWGGGDHAAASRWRVHFAQTARLKANPRSRDFCVEARTLIISAGALGSTELLLRSPKVSCSHRLGHGFSTNGDAIALGWGQKTPVHGMSAARPDSIAPSLDVGPTITGTLRTTVQAAGRTRQVLIQEGAVPSALSRAVIALGSSLSVFHRYTQDKAPAFFGDSLQADLLSTPAAIGEHAMLLLAMGSDDADGVVSLLPSQDSGARRRLDIRWDRFEPDPAAPSRLPETKAGGRSRYFRELHGLLRAAHLRGGFDGGDYLPNPAWRPVPDDFSAITGGNQPERLMTVHPLGGCGMADDAGGGVVDLHGAVFSGKVGSAVHAGLHVLDGAMVPCAIGVNPFLTISALSLVAARWIRAGIAAATTAPPPCVQCPALPTAQPAVPPTSFMPSGPVKLQFEERLQGRSLNASLPPWAAELLTGLADLDRLERTTEARSWVAVIKLSLDVDAWLADPSRPHAASLSIYHNPFPESQTVRPEVMRETPFLHGQGTVSLLAHDAPRDRSELRRRQMEAVATYLARRSTMDLQSMGQGDQSLFDGIRLYLRAGTNHAFYRELRYTFDLGSAEDRTPDVRIQVTGNKQLAYQCQQRSVWESLTELDLRLDAKDGGSPLDLAFSVDLADMVKGKRLQVLAAPSTPAAIVAMAAFGALWLRAIFQTQFWSFRGLSYSTATPLPVPPPGILRPDGLLGPAVQPSCHRLQVPRGGGHAGQLDLELTRYQPESPTPTRCILMIHGLAHGSGVFNTDTVGTNNLATFFVKNGYTVWLLDHRLSNRLSYVNEAHTIDDVARHDIACAMRLVYAANRDEKNRDAKISVFAHCVGAAAFSMSVLEGHLPAHMVKAAIIHAVHPWLVPSVTNRFSGALAAFYKDLLSDDFEIDPVPPSGKGLLRDELLDRFAATLPWPAEERHAHELHKYHRDGGFAVCNRMTLFYGREWVHDNLDQRTHERLAELVGSAGIEVFRQLYFMLLRERLTNRAGANIYLTLQNIGDHWRFPTLFAHGSRNKVFDVRSAMRSWKRLSIVSDVKKLGVPVRLWVKQGYGHMDFLFGKNAHCDIYPSLLEFLQAPIAFESRVGDQPASKEGKNVIDGEDISDYEFKAPVAPLCGPMLQIEGSAHAQRKLLMWFEQRFDTTSKPLRPMLELDGKAIEDFQDWGLPTQDARLGATALAKNKAVSAGAGFYRTVQLDETAARNFQNLGELRLTLRSERPGISSGSASANPGVRSIPGIDDPNLSLWDHKVPIGMFEKFFELSSMRQFPAPVELAKQPAYESEISTSLRLSHLPWWKRWTGQPVDVPVSLLATSCRWPGTPFERERADQLAARMNAHVEDCDLPVDGLVLLGDQIYADATANVAETTEKSERGAQRYRDSWSGPETACLFARLPTWLVVDDHEFADNTEGAGGRRKSDAAQNFTDGFEAAMAYQWRWHRSGEASPRLSPGGVRVERGFWHEFEVGGIPAFAADTRSERQTRTDKGWRGARMMHEMQFKAICDWLLAHRAEPKLLCSGSVFGLPERKLTTHLALCRHTDHWSGFPATWQRLATFIAVNEIANLVFLAGDYHLSAVVELEIMALGARKPARALSVIASGWNATLPFANARSSDFDWGTPVRITGGEPGVDVWSRATLVSTALRQFSKLTIQRTADGGWEVAVRGYCEDGTPTPPVLKKL